MPKHFKNFQLSLSLIQNRFSFQWVQLQITSYNIFPGSILLCIKQCAITVLVSLPVLSIWLFSLGSLAYIPKEWSFFDLHMKKVKKLTWFQNLVCIQYFHIIGKLKLYRQEATLHNNSKVLFWQYISAGHTVLAATYQWISIMREKPSRLLLYNPVLGKGEKSFANVILVFYLFRFKNVHTTHLSLNPFALVSFLPKM